MIDSKNVPKINVTNDYEIFKILDGNRSVSDGRVEKIISSIKNVGYIPSPIVVNENMQIIDGQGRFAALKSLGYPIYYIMVDGLTIEHCIAMNINQTNWKLIDYIESYANQGNENYQRLLDALHRYPSLGYFAVSAIFSRRIHRPDGQTVKNGDLIVDAKRIQTADKICSWLEQKINPLKGKIKGRFDYFLVAVAFCIEHTNVDKNRLAKVICENVYDIMPISSVLSAVKEIERLYNRGLSVNKIYIAVEYDKYMTINAVAYHDRWGNNR